jgi:exodeoxyribonuclease-3
MRIITFNVNGIRSAERKGFFDWFEHQNADFLCLQELKAHDHQVSGRARRPDGMHGYFQFANRPGYSGVALYTRKQPDQVHIGLSSLGGNRWSDVDTEGRYVQVDVGRLSVVSIYFPSGSSSAVRQAAKMSFLSRFLPFMETLLASGRELILCGDINIAHQRIDLKNWRGNQKNSGFLPEERAWMNTFLSLGLIDVFRALYPDREVYTWWSNRGRARENNVGWRIDYNICTPAIAAKAQDSTVYRQEWFSDHAPLITDFDFKL